MNAKESELIQRRLDAVCWRLETIARELRVLREAAERKNPSQVPLLDWLTPEHKRSNAPR